MDDIKTDKNDIVKIASKYGKLEVVKYLHLQGADIRDG